jgi:hypothetical protein
MHIYVQDTEKKNTVIEFRIIRWKKIFSTIIIRKVSSALNLHGKITVNNLNNKKTEKN